MLSNSESMPEQPQILLQLRQKASQLCSQQTHLRENNKQIANNVARASDELNILLRQKQIQQRKSKSLVLLVSDIQRQIDDYYSIGPDEDDEELLVAENKVLRELLVKLAERAKQDQKMLSFLRQASASAPKAQEFLQRSKYLQSQTQLLTKLRSQIASFSNVNMQCSRKWSELQRETQRLQRQAGFIRIQSQRIKTELRQYYEQYLQSLNRSKASLVNFNQTQRERVITEHLVEEVAFLQEKRLGIQQQSKNLKHHQQALLEQNARIQMQNRQLKSFFVSATGQEQHRLASKMRARIQQLRDSLAQTQKLRMIPQLPVSNLSQSIRGKLKSLQQTIAYIEKKIKEQQQGKISLQEKDIVQFFQTVLRNKDERLQISRERELASNQKLKEISIRRELLLNQISNLQEGMNYHHYQNTTYKIQNQSINIKQNPSIDQSKGRQYPTTVSGSIATQMQNWRDREGKNSTNILTTASKFIPN